MHFKDVGNFYQALINSEHFSESIKNKLQSIHDEEKYKIFIQDELIPLAKSMGYTLSVDDILSYEHQKLQQLTKEELENVTGGNDLTKIITTTFMSVLAIAGGVNFTQAIHTANAMAPTSRFTSRVVSDTKQSTKKT